MGGPDVDLEGLVSRLEAELPGFRLCFKDESRLQRLIGRLLWPFNRSYMTGYTTVMFGRVYFPSRAWFARQPRADLYCLLRHEAVHLRDMRRFPVLFQLSYLFLLPAVLSARAWWEWRAYRETIVAHFEVHGEVPDALLEGICDRFCGPDYLFMFPFRGFLMRRLVELARTVQASPQTQSQG